MQIDNKQISLLSNGLLALLLVTTFIRHIIMLWWWVWHRSSIKARVFRKPGIYQVSSSLWSDIFLKLILSIYSKPHTSLTKTTWSDLEVALTTFHSYLTKARKLIIFIFIYLYFLTWIEVYIWGAIFRSWLYHSWFLRANITDVQRGECIIYSLILHHCTLSRLAVEWFMLTGEYFVKDLVEVCVEEPRRMRGKWIKGT